MKIVALIPARAGSVRVLNKNLRILNGKTLIERKVLQLLSSGCIDEVYVGSDSEEILAVAEKSGATPIKRDDLACNEAVSPANVMIGDFAKRVSGDVAIWAHCTNPFVYGRHYKDAIDVFLSNLSKHDSLLSVTKIQSHMWNRFGFPVNYNPYAESHTLAKNVDPFYFQDGSIFIQKLSGFLENSYFFGRTPFLMELDFPYCFDINTVDEMDMAGAFVEYLDKKENFI